VSLDVVAGVNLERLHPLTGPVYIEGAEAGDLLDIEIVDVEPAIYGYAAQVPGFGFVRDEFPDPFEVDWTLVDG
jgi:formamidase